MNAKKFPKKPALFVAQFAEFLIFQGYQALF